MRRADRLFQIIQILRRAARPVTASELAAELEVSPRSVYRDVADLMGQRVPIRGEAGLEAAVLGAQWVAGRGDAVLAAAARDLIAKIAAVVPERLRPFLEEPSIGAPPSPALPADGLDIARTRAWIRCGRKIRIRYRDQQGQESERTIWPTIIGYAEAVRLLAAWCESRQDFRHFRTDRVLGADFLEEPCGLRAGELRRRWRRHMASDRGILLRMLPPILPARTPVRIPVPRSPARGLRGGRAGRIWLGRRRARRR
jgi:predicted DNA-binding transcriptional regulator YafY